MNRFLLMMAQIAIMVVCFIYIQHIYYDNILPDRQAKEVFEETDCFLVSKKLIEGGRFFKTYRADFFVNYTVNNINYKHWVSGNGLDESFQKNKSATEETLSQFIVGHSYSCWYNPTHPETVILVFRYNWTTTFPLILPSIVFLIVGYYFLQNLFLFLGGSNRDTKAIRYQEKRKK